MRELSFISIKRHCCFWIQSVVASRGADAIQRIITLAISMFIILDSVQFLLYVADCAAAGYPLGSLRLENVGGEMLYQLSTLLGNVLILFRQCKIAKKMHGRSVLAFSAFHV